MLWFVLIFIAKDATRRPGLRGNLSMNSSIQARMISAAGAPQAGVRCDDSFAFNSATRLYAVFARKSLKDKGECRSVQVGRSRRPRRVMDEFRASPWSLSSSERHRAETDRRIGAQRSTAGVHQLGPSRLRCGQPSCLLRTLRGDQAVGRMA